MFRVKTLLGMDGLVQVCQFSVMLWQKIVVSRFVLRLQPLAGATLIAVQMTNPAQAKAEVSLFKQLTIFPWDVHQQGTLLACRIHPGMLHHLDNLLPLRQVTEEVKLAQARQDHHWLNQLAMTTQQNGRSTQT